MSTIRALVTSLLLLSSYAAAAADSTDLSASGRTGTINLSGGTNSDFYTGLIYIIPIVLAIIILDFAIFGTFATRSDELNPISKFFFHAREGLHIMMSRRRPYGPPPGPPRAGGPPHSNPYAQARPAPHRVAR